MQCLILAWKYETCHAKEHWHKRVALTEYLPCTCSQVHHWIDPEQKKISRGPCTLNTHAEWTAVSGPYDVQRWVGECCASGQTKQHQFRLFIPWGDHMEPMSPLHFRARSLPATASRDGWSLLRSWKPGEMAYVCTSCDSCMPCDGVSVVCRTSFDHSLTPVVL